MQREQGLLERDCDKLVRNDRVIWSTCMVSCGDADAMVTGNTRRYSSSLEKVSTVVSSRPGEIIFGLNLVVNRGKTVLIADTAVNEWLKLGRDGKYCNLICKNSKAFWDGSKSGISFTFYFWSTNH